MALQVDGAHNVMNALAAASAAYVLGIRGEAVDVAAGLATFTARAAASSTKGTTTARTSTTTTPTIPASCTPC